MVYHFVQLSLTGLAQIYKPNWHGLVPRDATTLSTALRNGFPRGPPTGSGGTRRNVRELAALFPDFIANSSSSLNGTNNNPNPIQMPIQWVRSPAAGSQASSVVADREREDQILDLQALSRESLLASFRESLDPIRRIRVYSVRFRLIGSPNYLPSIHSTFQWDGPLRHKSSDSRSTLLHSTWPLQLCQ